MLHPVIVSIFENDFNNSRHIHQLGRVKTLFDKTFQVHKTSIDENDDNEGCCEVEGGVGESGAAAAESSGSKGRGSVPSTGRLGVARKLAESAAETSVPSLRRETRAYGKRLRLEGGAEESETSLSLSSGAVTSADDTRSVSVAEGRDGKMTTTSSSSPSIDASSPSPPPLDEVRRYAWTLFVHVKSNFPAIAADLVNRLAKKNLD